MKNKESTREDGITNEMLKCCSPIIEPHIATLFNNCNQSFKSIEQSFRKIVAQKNDAFL